jgi:hypothetical protein
MNHRSAVYHCAVLTLFRPFVSSGQALRLRSFSSEDSTVAATFLASVNQLKRLVFEFLKQSPRLPNCGWLNGSVTTISTILFRNTVCNPDWRFYLRLCVQFWKEAFVCHRVCFPVVRGHMSRAIELGAIDVAEAKAIVDEVRLMGRHHTAAEEGMTSAMLDFELAMSTSQPPKANVEALANRFEELLLFSELITEDYEDVGEVVPAKKGAREKRDNKWLLVDPNLLTLGCS